MLCSLKLKAAKLSLLLLLTGFILPQF